MRAFVFPKCAASGPLLNSTQPDGPRLIGQSVQFAYKARVYSLRFCMFGCAVLCSAAVLVAVVELSLLYAYSVRVLAAADASASPDAGANTVSGATLAVGMFSP